MDMKYKNGVIVVSTEARHQKFTQRNVNYFGTKYDSRNDPAWHFKNKQVFAVSSIATTTGDSAEVASLDALNLRRPDGSLVTQQFLDDHLGYLNGSKMIGNFTGVTTMSRLNQGQKALTRLKKRIQSHGEELRLPENEVRERRQILDLLDRQFLQVSLFSVHISLEIPRSRIYK